MHGIYGWLHKSCHSNEMINLCPDQNVGYMVFSRHGLYNDSTDHDPAENMTTSADLGLCHGSSITHSHI